jgi:hypothetical protein
LYPSRVSGDGEQGRAAFGLLIMRDECANTSAHSRMVYENLLRRWVRRRAPRTPLAGARRWAYGTWLLFRRSGIGNAGMSCGCSVASHAQ